jgi:MerR family transcriptional regulator, aldehyde-responsive regulator
MSGTLRLCHSLGVDQVNRPRHHFRPGRQTQGSRLGASGWSTESSATIGTVVISNAPGPPLDLKGFKFRILGRMDDAAGNQPSWDFTIQEVSRRTGLSEPTLRYYEKIGLIDPVSRDSSSRHRRYDAATVTRIESLANLRAVGLSIEDMRTLMHSRGHDPETIETKLGLLVAHSKEIAREISRLKARQRFVQNRIAYWTATQADDDAAVARLTEEGEALAKKLD